MERPGDPCAGDLRGGFAVDALAGENDLARVAPVVPADEVQKGRLPGPVRTDDGVDPSRLGDEVYPVERNDLGESPFEPLTTRLAAGVNGFPSNRVMAA